MHVYNRFLTVVICKDEEKQNYPNCVKALDRFAFVYFVSLCGMKLTIMTEVYRLNIFNKFRPHK
jgi:hypothetical protein